MAALNPVMRVGAQVAEALVVHGMAGKREARDRAIELLRAVKIVEPEQARRRLPASAVGRHAPAGDAGRGAGLQAAAGHRRRADHRARRHRAGADPRPAARDEADLRSVAAAHHPRPRRHRRSGRPRRRDVRRAHRRGRAGAGDLPGAGPSLHARAAGLDSARARRRAADGHRGHGAEPDRPAARLRVRAALPRPAAGVRPRRAARGDRRPTAIAPAACCTCPRRRRTERAS